MFVFAFDFRNAMFILLLLFSANLGLINRRLGIQNAAAQNLISGRDLLVLITILIGLAAYGRVYHWPNSFDKMIKFILFMTPLAVVWGSINGAGTVALAMGISVMVSWGIALSIGWFFQTHWQVQMMTVMIALVGILISLGVFVETLTSGSIAVVTPATEALSKTIRSTPTGWPTMLVAFSILMVSLLQTSNLFSMFFKLILLSIIATAALLTQSRTLVVAMVLSTTIFLTFVAIRSPRKINWLAIFATYAVATLTISVTLSLGENYHREGFSDYFIERYSVLHETKSASAQIEKDGRLAELNHILTKHVSESPILGKGLGTPVWSFSNSPTTHNIFGFFLLRFGIIGGVFWAVFCFVSIRSVWRRVVDPPDVSVWGQGLSVGILNLVIAAFLSNAFGATYGVQQAMIVVGCLIAYERIVDAQTYWQNPASRREYQ